MTVWQDLPDTLRDSGALDLLRDPLSSAGVELTDEVTTSEDGRTWRTRSAVANLSTITGGAIDPATGRIGSGGDTPIEFASNELTLSLGLRDDGAGGTDAWRLDLDVPGVRVRLPFLTGARLAADGMLEPDPDHVVVRLLVPRLVMRLSQIGSGAVSFELRSATTSGQPLDDVYSAVEMSPPYAFVGPGAVVGFAFRAAVLDLSGTNGPAGVPAGARAMPGVWQGFYLPEARLFVAPSGLDGIAVSAGVRNLWIGLGAHAGVTGTFSAEVVNRGESPRIHGRFITPAGRHVAAVEDGEVEVPTGSTFLADGEGGTAPVRLSLVVDGGASVSSDRTVLSVPASGSTSVVVTATSGGGQSATATFRAKRPAAAEGPGGGENPATWTLLTPATGAVVEVAQTATAITLRLEPRRTATWTWAGGGATGEEATIPAAAGADLEVTAVPDGVPTPLALDAYLRFDHPKPAEATIAWSRVADNIRTVAAAGPALAPTGATLKSLLGPATAASYAGLEVHVDGYASFEPESTHPTACAAGHGSCDYNQLLSERRAGAVAQVLKDAGITVAPEHVVGHGHTAARLRTPVAPGSAPPPTDGRWWTARVTATPAVVQPVRVRVRRRALTPPTQRDPAPPTSGRPDCFRRLGVEVEILRSTFIRCEVWGEFDIQTALETSLEQGGSPPLGGRTAANPMDGVCLFRVRLRIASDGGAWEVFGEFRAAEGDLDGLLERRAETADEAALNMAGAFAVMGPISAAVATLSPEAGALVQLGSIALGATGLLTTKVLTLHGGELVVSNGIIAPDGSTSSTASGAAAVMVDVEVQFTFNILDLIWVPPDKPIRTRYKAVGIKAGWSESGPAVPIPVFDPSRGYELDIQPGSIQAVPPLDEILRIFGVRVSRDNPTYLEIEAGIGVELGPVTIDTVRVRMRLDEAEPPQLTKLGASIDIPSTVHGSGVLEITEHGIKAALDITIIPLKIRATAVLAVETIDGVTGILIGIEVEFPVPLLLGNSGLGIFGLMAGVGINYARRENPHAALPALDWVTKQLSADRGTVMHPDGWTHTAGSYAFAGGLLLGTVEGGFVIHLKGIILIEIPGPRLLLVMKADVLKMPPTLMGEQSATFLAVLDIDFGRGTITLGIVASYTIDSILTIHVPVTAFFSTKEPENWRIDLGTYDDRITVTVLDVLEASGYLMVHGNGNTVPVLPPAYGLSIATGFHLQAVLMGSKEARLYVEVAAGFDAILGFDPFFLAGTIYIRGELMLFIISIGVSAKLDLAVGKREENGVWVDHPYVHGQVCGKVSFFFFDIEACLELTIGSPPVPDLQPRPLVEGLTLVGRSPALVEGSGTGHSMDASLGEAPESGVTPAPEVPVVPLDAIPVLSFSATPEATGLTFFGAAPNGSSGVNGASAWQRIGERWWAYKITRIEMTGALLGTDRPATWWNDATPTGQQAVPALGLLTWLPTPFSRAIAFGETLITSVEHRWGTACDPTVPAQPQLWTFGEQPLGPDADGWRLPGVVWRDPAGLPRSAPAQRWLRVREPWRTGRAVADSLAGVEPARVVGDLVLCDTSKPVDGAEPLGGWASGITKGRSQASPAPSFGQATHLLMAGELGDLQSAAHDAASDPEDLRGDVCPGRILRAPWRESKDVEERLLSQREVEALRAARDEVGHRPDELADAVVLDAQEELVDARLLLVATLERSRPLLVVARDREGRTLSVVQVDNGMLVGGGNPLPSTWVDVDGPWARPVTLAGRAAAGVIRGNRMQGLFLVDLRGLDPRTTTLAVGWEGTGAQAWEQPVHVVAIEALTAAEVTRADWDTTVATSDKESFETGLTHDPNECALLTPGATYTVAVTWEWDSEEGDEQPTTLPQYGGATTQTFTFAAHPDTESPRDLRPWLLDTDPGMGDTGLLRHEPVRVALAHQRVPALFEAYGRRLEVTVLSASGHHPRPPGGGAPGSPLVIPVRAEDDVLDLVATIVGLPILSAWDEAASRVAAALPCVPVDEVVRSGSRVTIGYELDPLTDYLLDVHSVPLSGVGEKHRVFRANFTTSRFTDLAHLASWIRPTSPEHRLVRDRAPLDALPPRPSGDAWDDAVQRAGLPVPVVPTAPRVEIWWSADAVPQPLAVVLECSESLLRERATPVVCTPPADTPDPLHTWWGTGVRAWLEIEGHGTPDAGDATPSGPLVIGPGGTRVLVRLDPGARGKRLRLDLVRNPDLLEGGTESRELAVDVLLARAPWEVED